MNLDEFLHNLHFNIDEVRPVDIDVDWADAPLAFKLYQNLPAVSLSPQTPLSFHSIPRESRSGVHLEDIGDFLWYCYGLTQMCHMAYALEEGESRPKVLHMLRRYAPSGGGLYPNELYGYFKVEGLAPGIYHYDVAHHRLVLLRQGNFDKYIEQALGLRCNLARSFGALFISTMFWKNSYKYNHFSYRLQGLDAGALTGQVLAVAKEYDYESAVHFQFLDKAVNHLLGLSDKEETVYAVIPLCLREDVNCVFRPTHNEQTSFSSDLLCKELGGLLHKHYVKSERIGDFPLLLEANEASMMDSTASFEHLQLSQTDPVVNRDGVVVLPEVPISPSPDFAQVCRVRYSPGLDYVSHQLSLDDLSALLIETTRRSEYHSDLVAGDRELQDRVQIALCAHGVEGLSDGAYRYDVARHELRLVHAGDHRMALQLGMSMPTVNLFQVPLCFHFVGRRDITKTFFGYRGYRIQQMEAGILLQALLLALASMGMSGHPLLGYDAITCDEIYKLTNEDTCLIQVPAGFYQKKSRFEGPLHS